ncbi:MAG: DEAD/DEAH box helicase [Candidatus Rokuibacteriota bacterium]
MRSSAPVARGGVAPGLVFSLTPGGTLVVREAPDADPVDPASAKRIGAAFARGVGHGLLQLGAAEVDTALPPSIGFWRDVGRAFVTYLCAQPELEGNRKRLHLPFPEVEIAALAAGAPPMPGGEYLTAGALASLWEAMNAACRVELAEFDGPVEVYLRSRSAVWHVVGRVHFHLAENRAEPDAPFAFLATYSTRLGNQGKPRHRPLGEAIREYAGAGNRPKLLALLQPVQRAAARSELLRGLVDAGDVYRPLGLTAEEAYRFLKDIPIFEESGVVVRVPDWWAARRPPRPRVQVSIGTRAPAGLGTDGLLDFDVRVTLEGQTLSEAEIRQVASSSEGLALIRGKWVELDPARLREALEHWRRVKAAAGRDGLSFIEGMRLLSGAALGESAANVPPAETAVWSDVVAGPWLKEALDDLRGPESLRDVSPPRGLGAELRPYQEVGVRWLSLLHRLGLGACLADDMGLGKTIQVLALLLTLKERAASARDKGPALLVVPASLIANWRAEIDRFAPSLRVLVAHPSEASIAPEDITPEDLAGLDLVITTYGLTHRLGWLAETEWPVVVLDEAQAIKNPAAKQAQSVKALRARSRVALTGTPVENRLTDLWSIFDFLNPGLLGSGRAFASFAKQLGTRPGGFAPLRELTRPYILRRLKTDRQIIADLPEKTELRAYCGLSRVQAALYQESVRSLAGKLEGLDGSPGIERRGIVLAYLMRLKQICNHPSQWLRDGAWAAEASGKFSRLRELAEVISDKQEKALVFTQFQETTEPLARFLGGVFGRPGLVMHGATPVRMRRELVEQFQQDEVPFFVLSLKVGGTGLNLTAASHVIHFDRWWNPAVEDQATDRAFRIGQTKNVLVHKFVCRGTLEEKIDALIEGKQRMAREVLHAGGEAILTEMSDAELLRVVSLDLRTALAAA